MLQLNFNEIDVFYRNSLTTENNIDNYIKTINFISKSGEISTISKPFISLDFFNPIGVIQWYKYAKKGIYGYDIWGVVKKGYQHTDFLFDRNTKLQTNTKVAFGDSTHFCKIHFNSTAPSTIVSGLLFNDWHIF